jgi:hypothetical protein
VVLGGDARTHLLTDYASRASEGRPVLDPFGGDLDTYRETFVELERTIARVFERIVSERSSGGA